MDRTERFYRIEQLLRTRRVVPIAALLAELGVSRATFKRDIEYLRSRLHAPIVWDRAAGGYRFAQSPAGGPRFELPGVWFSAEEVLALLTMEHLLERLQPGLLARHIGPLRERLGSMLGSSEHGADEVRRRVRVITLGARRGAMQAFETIAAALLARKRLSITHYHRGRDETSEREVSPQRLVHYRENWYLDAWCHRSAAIRSFAVDAIRAATPLERPARDIPDRRLDAQLTGGYGIFGGRARRRAVLRFTPERARWVASEQWHERQRSRLEADGSYVLEVPYADDRELVMDILRHGAEVQVLGPPALRDRVRALHARAARRR